MTQVLTSVRVIVSHTGDRKITERESAEREEEKSPGTKKEGELSWSMFA